MTFNAIQPISYALQINGGVPRPLCEPPSHCPQDYCLGQLGTDFPGECPQGNRVQGPRLGNFKSVCYQKRVLKHFISILNMNFVVVYLYNSVFPNHAPIGPLPLYSNLMFLPLEVVSMTVIVVVETYKPKPQNTVVCVTKSKK